MNLNHVWQQCSFTAETGAKPELTERMARKIWTEILVPTTSASEQIRKSYPCLREALDLILQGKKVNLRTASGKVAKEPPILACFTCIPGNTYGIAM